MAAAQGSPLGCQAPGVEVTTSPWWLPGWASWLIVKLVITSSFCGGLACGGDGVHHICSKRC